MEPNQKPEFFQDGPQLKNQYEDDAILRSFLKRRLPGTMLAEIEPGLQRLGERAVGEILALGNEAEAQVPRHVPYDPWGRRIDDIEVSRAWRELDRISAEEGLIAIGYERKHGAWSRVHQFAKLYLFGPSSAIYTCPLAMTDGAARAIELYGDAELKAGAYRHLTSWNPSEFWTSGQWMTERTGGSDVSGTSTVARLVNGEYRLHGTKWFTSATTSQMTMTLARPEGAAEGSRGLSLFYVELRDKQGRLQNIRVHRLKDKLGTKALPTAELTLEGTPARLVGGEGNGVKKISSLFNITRIYNSVCAVGFMRRGIALSRDYARRRVAFGKPLAEQPLHLETLANLETEFQGAFQLVFHLVELLGKDETGTATAEESAVLRLLTPIAKLYTAKQSIAVTSEILESFGGAGYIEDTGLPRLLRDAQVLAIWEGTTNVLSLDALRAIEKEQALPPFLKTLHQRLGGVRAPELQGTVGKARQAVQAIEGYLPQAMKAGEAVVQANARQFAFALARTYIASLLLEHAEWSLANHGGPAAQASALRWCEQDLAPLHTTDAQRLEASRILALGGQT